MSKQALSHLIDSLTDLVQSLSWQPSGADWNWTDYYQGDSYSAAGFEDKKRIVQGYLEQAQPGTVWDLGANTGVFSRLASERHIATIAWDVDPGAVELNYRHLVETGERDLLPLILDLTNPSPSLGWSHQERESFVARGGVDLVMALALIHHLAISNNVPLEQIAHLFAGLGRWLIIEFVPRSDRKVQQLLASREDIFASYTQEGFEAAFARYFEPVESQPITDSQRRLYLMRARSGA
jgi:ribosomal protein L11 methylase PrmA